MINDEKILCLCLAVTFGDIRKAIENGASSFEDVQKATHCAMSCGGCASTIRNVVNTLLLEKEGGNV